MSRASFKQFMRLLVAQQQQAQLEAMEREAGKGNSTAFNAVAGPRNSKTGERSGSPTENQ
ncbi:MAG: hypothetical protein ABJM29_00310 [Rhizobiaceae bacterium]